MITTESDWDALGIIVILRCGLMMNYMKVIIVGSCLMTPECDTKKYFKSVNQS